jgi:predicted nucleic acid-binding protein
VILVDSSVWIDLLRQHNTPQTHHLRELLGADQSAITSVIYQEILQGASSPENFATLRDYFSTQTFLFPHDPIATYEAAAVLYDRCRRQGITPRSPHDCLIAQIAIEQRVPLLHNDRDYVQLARVVPELQLLP